MFKFPSVSIIITSYNQARTLELLFASLERQTYQNFEVIIADDGSTDRTRAFCSEPRKFPVQFVTHEDLGYRKAKILNQALRHARADYLIYLDGDLILEQHFVEDHMNLRSMGHFVCGRRVNLGPKISSTLTVQDIETGKFDRLNLNVILSSIMKDTKDLKRAIRITLSELRRLLGYDHSLDLLGSNFSAWTADIKAVNGFNEAMASYWGEDGDLYIRLRNSGRVSIGAKALCIQYHIFHKRRIPTKENEKKYEELLKTHDYVWAAQGFNE